MDKIVVNGIEYTRSTADTRRANIAQILAWAYDDAAHGRSAMAAEHIRNAFDMLTEAEADAARERADVVVVQ